MMTEYYFLCLFIFA